MDSQLGKLTIEPEKRAKRDLSGQQKRKWLLIGVGVFLIFGIGLYRYIYYAIPVEAKLLSVSELGLPPIVLTAGGYLVADPQIVVSSRLTGKIESISVKEGDVVTAGEILAKIESRDLKAQYEEAKRASELSSTQFSRMQKLYGEDVVSRREMEMAEAESKREKARYESLKFNYEQTEIHAPIDGTVVELIRKSGEFLSPGITQDGDSGSGILKLGNLEAMKVELDINENDIGKIKVGQAVLVFPDAMVGETLKGQVLEISPRADRQKSIVPIKVKFDKGTVPLKPEMSARVLFLEREMTGNIERAILIPENAVVRRSANQATVYVFEEGRAVKRAIELADRGENGLLKVKSGLKEGDVIILDPPLRLRDHKRVKVESE